MSRLPRGPWRSVALVILVCGLGVAAGAGWTVRSVEAHDQNQLLRERASELEATLGTTIQTAKSSLSILSASADQSQSDPGIFEQAAASLLKQGVTAVGFAAATGNVLKVSASIGAGPSLGQMLTGDREALAHRALSAHELVTAMLRNGAETRLVLAIPDPLGNGVLYEETVVHPSQSIPDTKNSPYHELQVAIYAGSRPDARQLILSTASGPTLSAQVVTLRFPVGADTWTLVVGARQPLAGGLVGWAPWFVAGMGTLLALLVFVVVRILVRRRSYSEALVDSATRELTVIKEFLENVLEKGPTVVLRGETADGEPRITYASPNLAPVFQIEPRELVAAGTLLGWVEPRDAPAVDVARSRLAEASGNQTIEYRLRQPDGSYRWASVTYVYEIGEPGTGPFAVYLNDISLQRAAQDAIREAMETAQAANRSKTDFLSRVSHELRTPLNAILGFGQLVRDASTGELRDDTEHILKAGRHLLDLIDEILDIARIESGDLAISPEPVALDELLLEAIDLVRPMAATHSVHIATEGCRSCHVYAFADRQRTKQIVLNLLSNAIKYNRRMGTVALSCAPGEGGRILVKVVDTGRGIAPEFAEALFAPFERLDAVNSDVEGTGIGLALSRRLAEAMGATLTFESVLGQGSTFILDVPLVEGPVERFERLDHPGSYAQTASNGSAAHKVLYIEDNLSNLRLIERILTRRPEVSLVSAMQGRLGLELARDHLPMLILLDLHLADIGGDEVLRQLLADPVTSSIPVVILSADATPSQIGRLLSAGAVAYLTKPIDVDELLSHVDAAARKEKDLVAER